MFVIIVLSGGGFLVDRWCPLLPGNKTATHKQKQKHKNKVLGPVVFAAAFQ